MEIAIQFTGFVAPTGIHIAPNINYINNFFGESIVRAIDESWGCAHLDCQKKNKINKIVVVSGGGR